MAYNPYNGGYDQRVGVRFGKINVPQGATITEAYIQFTADEEGGNSTNLTLYAHDTDNAPEFAEQDRNISSRERTSASVEPGARAPGTIPDAPAAPSAPPI